MDCRYSRLIGLVVLLGIPISAQAAPDYFIKKDTWLETVMASREALVAREAKVEQKARQVKDTDPALKAFTRTEYNITGKTEPQTVKVSVAGLKKVCIGAKSQYRVIFANPNLIDSSGKAVPVDYTKTRSIQLQERGSHFTHDGTKGSKPIQRAKQTFDRWMSLENVEVEIRLDGKYDFLEMTVTLLENRDDRKARLWVDWFSVGQQAQDHNRALMNIWELTTEAFSDHASYRQHRLEEALGIWQDAWEPNDWDELASRYARLCGPLQARAEELAKNSKSFSDMKAVRDLFYVQHAEARLELADRTLAFVEKSASRPELAAELRTLKEQLSAAKEGKASGEALYVKACDLRKRIILSHPLLDFPNLLINKRSGQLPEHMCDQYLGRHSQVAPGLVVLENWRDPQPRQKVLLEGKLPKGGLIHPCLSWDAKRVLFAFADHEAKITDNRLRGYYIYEYNFETQTVRQITGTDRDAMEGRNGRQSVLVEDMNPCYLPDGGLAFISTRSQQFGRCHGGRYVPSYTLYRAEVDGSSIKALSYNESNEWSPVVLPDGSIIYCRWDYVDRHDVLFQSLWTIRPDGTQTAHYYGNNSAAPCLTSEAQPIPDSHKVVFTGAAHHGQTLGSLAVVDPYVSQEEGSPLKWVTPELSFPESGIPKDITRTTMPPVEDAQGGRAGTPWPISEDLFLCTYQYGPERQSKYAIFLVDSLGGREMICYDAATSCFDPIPLRPRPAPPVLPSAIADKTHEKTGIFAVQNVYESTQPIPRGSIKAMRINEIISQPTSSHPPRSRVENQLVKKILGTVPVNEDGSVVFEAPANTGLQFQLLDANGMAVLTMRSMVYVQPGEKAACIGCHENRYNAPPVPATSIHPAEIRRIIPGVGPKAEGGLSFLRHVQPVLDRNCIRCHGLEKMEKGLDLTGAFVRMDKDGKPESRPDEWRNFSYSYQSLLSAPGMVSLAHRNVQTWYSKPNDYFATAGKLAKMLMAGHVDKDGKKRVELDPVSLQRILDWLDLNAQFYGDYSFNRVETRPVIAAKVKQFREAVEKRFGPELAKQPFATLVNAGNVSESRILMAPLPVAAGGWGQITTNAYANVDDPAYKEMQTLAQECFEPLEHHDIAGTCGHEKGCRCGCCWARVFAETRKARLAEKTEKVAVQPSN